ncbi:MAG: M55 family metallopeptidase [Planctomycetota bacterium]
MKVFIETDIEGVAGFCFEATRIAEPLRQDEYRRTISRLLTEEVKAAVEGAREAGAEEIVVHDGHGLGYNILLEELPVEVGICHGLSAYAPNWQAGLDRTFDAVLAVGGHVMKDTNGITPHTLFLVNGRLKLGEFHMTAALAGWLGVPFVFASGDATLGGQLKALVPNLEYAAVKEALTPYYSKTLAPQKARALIRSGVARALRRLKEIRPYKLPFPPPYEVGVLGSDYQDPRAIGRSNDFWEAVMQVLETIYYYDYARQDPWPLMHRGGPILNRHVLLARAAAEKSSARKPVGSRKKKK